MPIYYVKPENNRGTIFDIPASNGYSILLVKRVEAYSNTQAKYLILSDKQSYNIIVLLGLMNYFRLVSLSIVQFI